ncbi:hypothetical protein DPMN_088760 [Dreissena polymorpha]|uniref:Uncharacterized protein n=1 Tax=Dreissena polymorpha TaxID=45954 RepID=A0A9D4KVH8_DREPO|nr:hypothetical protein DPMN_088760 [Dreissena polymorpha]
MVALCFIVYMKNKSDTPNAIAESNADFMDKQQRCLMATKTVLISKISHTRDENQNVNPSMGLNKEQNDHAQMRTLFLVKKTRHERLL